jgi:hypothetical protein
LALLATDSSLPTRGTYRLWRETGHLLRDWKMRIPLKDYFTFAILIGRFLGPEKLGRVTHFQLSDLFTWP